MSGLYDFVFSPSLSFFSFRPTLSLSGSLSIFLEIETKKRKEPILVRIYFFVTPFFVSYFFGGGEREFRFCAISFEYIRVRE